jgi:hypothetical protein
MTDFAAKLRFGWTRALRLHQPSERQINPIGAPKLMTANRPQTRRAAGLRVFSLICRVTQRAAEIVAWTF